MSGKVTEAVVAKIETPTELVKEEEIQQKMCLVWHMRILKLIM